MCNEDLPAINDLGKWDCLVRLPVLDCLGGLGEDDKVVLVALEMDLALAGVSTHIDILL